MYMLTQLRHKNVQFTVKTSCGLGAKHFIGRGGRGMRLCKCGKRGKRGNRLPQLVSVVITGNNVYAYSYYIQKRTFRC